MKTLFPTSQTVTTFKNINFGESFYQESNLYIKTYLHDNLNGGVNLKTGVFIEIKEKTHVEPADVVIVQNIFERETS